MYALNPTEYKEMTNMLFVCDCCGNVDSLRLSVSEGRGFQCYRCLNGEWHNQFEEEKYDPQVHVVVNRANRQYGDLGEASFG